MSSEEKTSKDNTRAQPSLRARFNAAVKTMPSLGTIARDTAQDLRQPLEIGIAVAALIVPAGFIGYGAYRAIKSRNNLIANDNPKSNFVHQRNDADAAPKRKQSFSARFNLAADKLLNEGFVGGTRGVVKKTIGDWRSQRELLILAAALILPMGFIAYAAYRIIEYRKDNVMNDNKPKPVPGMTPTEPKQTDKRPGMKPATPKPTDTRPGGMSPK